MKARQPWSPLIKVDSKGIWRRFCEVDPEFAKLVGSVMEQIMAKGALDPKTKALIRLGMAAAAGLQQGTYNVAELARALGATEDEIKETVRLAFLSPGLMGLAAGMQAFRVQGEPTEKEEAYRKNRTLIIRSKA